MALREDHSMSNGSCSTCPQILFPQCPLRLQAYGPRLMVDVCRARSHTAWLAFSFANESATLCS
eukprot:2663264-Amphidinium_carterae.1